MKNQNPTRKVRCNLLQAEVYVRFPVSTLEDGTPVKRYVELQTVPCDNGELEEYVEVDYPITEESVNSYADSADYRKNPDVVANAIPRQNLGDVSELQKILRNDMSAMRDMLAQSQEVMKKLEEAQKASTAPVQSAPDQVVTNGGENNG